MKTKKARRKRKSPASQSQPTPIHTSLEEYAALKASIRRHGRCYEPIIKNKNGKIISGSERLRACQELGLPRPKTIVVSVSNLQAEELALELNTCRKYTSLKTKRQLAGIILRDRPSDSDNSIAIACGVSDKTVTALRQRMEAASEIPKVKIRKGRDGKAYPAHPSVLCRSEAQEKRACDALRELGADAPVREMLPHNLARAMRDIRRTRIPPQPPLPSGEIEIEHSDFRKLQLQPASVDLIFTDPLYGKEYLPLYSDLAKFAAKVLKPGCILMAYAPQLYLNDVIRRLDEHLVFHWQCVLVNDECSQPNFSRGFFSGHRPVLVYTKGKSHRVENGRVEGDQHYVRDTFHRGRKEKSLYVYQQPVDEAIYYIGKLTKPGDLIVDCFGGAFTTAEAVYRLGGRRFIGCDIDETCVAMGRKRLSELMESSAA